MTLDQVLQIAILLVGIVALLVPMHLSNRAKGQGAARRIAGAREALEEARAAAEAPRTILRSLPRGDRRATENGDNGAELYPASVALGA
jgi:di/tricarboxylate transporter